MAKIMLVEDDNNLREIYGARLLAEGYEIVSAKDGEEALAMAVKEKPDLIISDIMMPKISGFDMLDILRSTAETKHTKVIMMTALSQVEDKERADRLGADRYLVKSQVTLEDVAKAAREVLADTNPSGTPAPVVSAAPTPAPEPVAPIPVSNSQVLADTLAAIGATAPAPAPVDPAPTAAPIPTPTPTSAPEPIVDPSTLNPAPAPIPAPVDPTPAPEPVTPIPPVPTPAPSVMAPGEQSKTSVHTKVINPINDITQSGPDFEKLLAEEEAKEANSSALNTATTAVPIVNDITPPPVVTVPEDQPETIADDPVPVEPTA